MVRLLGSLTLGVTLVGFSGIPAAEDAKQVKATTHVVNGTKDNTWGFPCFRFAFSSPFLAAESEPCPLERMSQTAPRGSHAFKTCPGLCSEPVRWAGVLLNCGEVSVPCGLLPRPTAAVYDDGASPDSSATRKDGGSFAKASLWPGIAKTHCCHSQRLTAVMASEKVPSCFPGQAISPCAWSAAGNRA